MKPFIYDMEYVREKSSQNMFNVVSLFAGGGGSSTGYRLAGGRVLAINEFIESARDTYRENYPDTHIFPQDVRELTGEIILKKIGLKKGELDILDGSPPCSSFSSLGQKEKAWGEVKTYSETEQRTDDLFFEFARILKEVQPKVFVCENVKGITQGSAKTLLGSEQMGLFGEHEDTIFYALTSSGYKVRYKILNAKNFGVPQSRERTIFIGVRNDIEASPSYPSISQEMVGIEHVVNNLKYVSCMRGFGEKNNRVINKEDVSYTILEDGMGATRRYRVMREGLDLSTIPLKHREQYFSMEDFTGIDFKENKSYLELSRFSIDELKSICSFPTDYNLTGSYNRQWERLGRSVPPLMMRSIAQHIYTEILKNK